MLKATKNKFLILIAFLFLLFVIAIVETISFFIKSQSPSFGVLIWWLSLVGISTFNISYWYHSQKKLHANIMQLSKETVVFRKWQSYLSLGYVLGCSIRSLFPKADVQRICLNENFMSSVFVGRTIATIAEMCFALQLALILREYSRQSNYKTGSYISIAMIGLISLAELFSWSAVISTCYLGNAIEESLWAVTMLILGIGLLGVRAKAHESQKIFFNFSILIAFTYVGFMAMVDVPMYIYRFIEDQKNSKMYLGLTEGLIDLWNRRVVTFQLSDWTHEIPWMTLYFSVAVIISISLINAPKLRLSK